ncbi:MAG: hypothetical protein AB8B83_03575 [Bdellovibrionales bacterium]
MSINERPLSYDPVSASALSGFDEIDINAFMREEVIRERIHKMPDSDAKSLYLDLDDILLQEDAEHILTNRVNALSPEDMAQYSKFLTIRNSVKSSSAIIAVLNANGEFNEYDIDHMIKQAKDNGVNAEQIGNIIGTIQHWKTGTSHPTQHLSDDGKQLFRELLAINQLPVDERPTAAAQIIDKMFDVDLTRKEKMTVREETINDRDQAKLHRQGQRKTYRALKASLEKHYSEYAPNLLEGHIRMTLPYHTWNGAGDCDGKPNADKVALLEGMVGYTRDAIDEHLSDIKRAIELEPDLAESLKNSKSSLEKVQKRLKGIEDVLLGDEDFDYKDLKAQYSKVYDGLSVDYSKNDDFSVNSEKELYEKLTVGLRHVVEEVSQGKGKAELEDTLFVMRQYKNTFTTAKIEKRAPGPVDVDIMNTLFGDRDFQRAYLTGSMKRSLASRVFTSLSDEEQMAMMKRVGQFARQKPGKALEHYYRVFPEGLDDKGFPNQLRERGERLELQKIHPDKFGMSIVAEAKKMSPEYEYFLGEKFFGVGRMMHTMLNEDMETLEDSADYVIDFSKDSGQESFKRAVENDPRLEDYLEKLGAMLPCSDSVKQLGPAAMFIQARAINHLMKYAVQTNQTICIKWGNGQVLTRGGGNAHIPGRMKAQAIQWHLNGRALDPDDKNDKRILANVMFASNTEQGRAADFMSANANRISSNHLKMIGEMIGRSLELMGKVPRGTYIHQAAKFSKGARSVFESIAKDVMMRGYENMRDAVDQDGKRISDEVADQASNMKIAGDANQAARPDSKAAIVNDATSEAAAVATSEDKPLYDLRAIGTTVAISHMRTFHDGWAFDGEGLRAVHEAYINREIGDGDLKEFLKDPLWSSMIKNGLRTASLSDMPFAMNRLGAGDWSHEKAMRIGKSVEVFPSANPKKDPPLFTYEGSKDTITPQQAFAAKLYYDQALFVTYAEEFSKLTLNIDASLPAMGTKPEKVRKALNKIEQFASLHNERTDGQIGRFLIGEATNHLFPHVDQDNNGNRREMLASQVLCDVAEGRHAELSKEQRFAVTASQRASQTWNNVDLYMDQDAYGSVPNPLLQAARSRRASLSADADYGYELAARELQ